MSQTRRRTFAEKLQTLTLLPEPMPSNTEHLKLSKPLCNCRPQAMLSTVMASRQHVTTWQQRSTFDINMLTSTKQTAMHLSSLSGNQPLLRSACPMSIFAGNQLCIVVENRSGSESRRRETTTKGGGEACVRAFFQTRSWQTARAPGTSEVGLRRIRVTMLRGALFNCKTMLLCGAQGVVASSSTSLKADAKSDRTKAKSISLLWYLWDVGGSCILSFCMVTMVLILLPSGCS